MKCVKSFVQFFLDSMLLHFSITRGDSYTSKSRFEKDFENYNLLFIQTKPKVIGITFGLV
jgi:hypothetical protein